MAEGKGIQEILDGLQQSHWFKLLVSTEVNANKASVLASIQSSTELNEAVERKTAERVQVLLDKYKKWVFGGIGIGAFLFSIVVGFFGIRLDSLMEDSRHVVKDAQDRVIKGQDNILEAKKSMLEEGNKSLKQKAEIDSLKNTSEILKRETDERAALWREQSAFLREQAIALREQAGKLGSDTSGVQRKVREVEALLEVRAQEAENKAREVKASASVATVASQEAIDAAAKAKNEAAGIDKRIGAVEQETRQKVDSYLATAGDTVLYSTILNVRDDEEFSAPIILTGRTVKLLVTQGEITGKTGVGSARQYKLFCKFQYPGKDGTTVEDRCKDEPLQFSVVRFDVKDPKSHWNFTPPVLIAEEHNPPPDTRPISIVAFTITEEFQDSSVEYPRMQVFITQKK
jgi:hypothetical protein